LRLVVNEPGTFVGARKGMVVVRSKGEEVVEVAVPKIEMVAVLTRGASVSSALLRLLSKHRIPLVIYSSLGSPLSHLSGYRRAGVKLRKEQYKAQEDARGIQLAKSFAIGKVLNQRELLYSMAKNRRKSNPKLADLLLEASRFASRVAERIEKIEPKDLDHVRAEAIREEAEASERYWAAVREALRGFVDFPGRRKKFDRPTDPINVSLNYLYSVMAGECWVCLDSAGLDPYAGFLHADSPRRPALVMDLLEEFRQPVVDRVVLRMVYEREVEGIVENGKLRREARLKLYRRLSERLSDRVTFRSRALPIRDHVLLQARRIAEHVMSRGVYVPFVA